MENAISVLFLTKFRKHMYRLIQKELEPVVQKKKMPLMKCDEVVCQSITSEKI